MQAENAVMMSIIQQTTRVSSRYDWTDDADLLYCDRPIIYNTGNEEIKAITTSLRGFDTGQDLKACNSNGENTCGNG